MSIILSVTNKPSLPIAIMLSVNLPKFAALGPISLLALFVLGRLELSGKPNSNLRLSHL